MKLIYQSHDILYYSENALRMIEKAGRTCYKSESKISEDSAEKFVRMIIKRGHHAMLEFGDITVRFVTNRGVTHEKVRHRLCSFAQESTRYVKYGGDMEFIDPVWRNESSIEAMDVWLDHMLASEKAYQKLLHLGWKPQQAREVLPNSLKTEIVVKGNLREWRHIFTLRCASSAHPQMYKLMRPLLAEVKTLIPVLFDDITY